MHLGGARLDAGDETSSDPDSDSAVSLKRTKDVSVNKSTREKGETHERAAARLLPSEIPPVVRLKFE